MGDIHKKRFLDEGETGRSFIEEILNALRHSEKNLLRSISVSVGKGKGEFYTISLIGIQKINADK